MAVPPLARIAGGRKSAFWIAASAVVALDQLSKCLLGNPAADAHRIVLVPMFLRLVQPKWNPRGAFSWGPEGTAFYVVAALIGLALVGWFLVSTRRGRLPLYIGLGCVAGGALGNLVDRITLGAVRDFIDLHWMDKVHWPTFNIADASICLGVGLLVWETLGPGSKRETEGRVARPGSGPR